MTNVRVAAYNTSVQVIDVLFMCPTVFVPSGIWGIMTLSCASTTTTSRVVIYVSIAIAKVFAVESVVNVSIAVAIVVAIVISISIAIVIIIVTNISIGIADETGFHLWFKGTYKLLQCTYMSTYTRVG